MSVSRIEYEALVCRVRGHFGNSVSIGTTSGDLIRLRKLDAQRVVDVARDAEERPAREAAGRLHKTIERARAAWRKIEGAQETISKNRRLHQINGVPAEWLAPIEFPDLKPPGLSTVGQYDAANAAAAAVATEMETLAQKLVGYINEWDRAGSDGRNLSLIFKLAERIDALERGSA